MKPTHVQWLKECSRSVELLTLSVQRLAATNLRILQRLHAQAQTRELERQHHEMEGAVSAQPVIVDQQEPRMLQLDAADSTLSVLVALRPADSRDAIERTSTITAMTSLTSVSVSDCLASIPVTLQALRCLSAANNLRSLSLSGVWPCPTDDAVATGRTIRGIETIFTAIGSLTTLHALDLSSFNVHEEMCAVAEFLAPQLTSLRSLRALNVRHLVQTSSGAAAMPRVLTCMTALQVLIMHHNSDGDHLIALFQSLATVTSLRSLDTSVIDHPPKDLGSHLTALRALHDLRITGLYLRSCDLLAFAHTLTVLSALTVLDLSGFACTARADGCCNDTNLTQLQKNADDAQTALKALAKSLSVMTSLRTLILRDVSMQRASTVCRMRNAVTSLTRLTALDCQDSIGMGGIQLAVVDKRACRGSPDDVRAWAEQAVSGVVIGIMQKLTGKGEEIGPLGKNGTGIVRAITVSANKGKAGVGWTGSVQNSDPRKFVAAPEPDGSGWWRQSHESTFGAALAHVINDGRTYTQATPTGQCRWGPMPMRCSHQTGNRYYYLSYPEHTVVKAYCIGAAGQQPTEPQDIDFAALACQDAAATCFVCWEERWEYRTFGLVHGGHAYVCITRRVLQQAPAGRCVAALVLKIAHSHRLLHNDGHPGNWGMLKLEHNGFQMQLFDWERASLYHTTEELPPFNEHFEKYKDLCGANPPSEAKQSELRALMQSVKRTGLDATRKYFAGIVQSGRLFTTAFDRVTFAASPRGMWKKK